VPHPPPSNRHSEEAHESKQFPSMSQAAQCAAWLD
jgi:hypothetical protein